MSTRKTIIEVTISGDKFVAHCPHVPDYEVATAADERDSRAVSKLIAQLREYTRGETAWTADPEINQDADQVLRLSGLWPACAVEPEPIVTTENEDKEEGNGD